MQYFQSINQSINQSSFFQLRLNDVLINYCFLSKATLQKIT